MAIQGVTSETKKTESNSQTLIPTHDAYGNLVYKTTAEVFPSSPPQNNTNNNVSVSQVNPNESLGGSGGIQPTNLSASEQQDVYFSSGAFAAGITRSQWEAAGRPTTYTFVQKSEGSYITPGITMNQQEEFKQGAVSTQQGGFIPYSPESQKNAILNDFGKTAVILQNTTMDEKTIQQGVYDLINAPMTSNTMIKYATPTEYAAYLSN